MKNYFFLLIALTLIFLSLISVESRHKKHKSRTSTKGLEIISEVTPDQEADDPELDQEIFPDFTQEEKDEMEEIPDGEINQIRVSKPLSTKTTLDARYSGNGALVNKDNIGDYTGQVVEDPEAGEEEGTKPEKKRKHKRRLHRRN